MPVTALRTRTTAWHSSRPQFLPPGLVIDSDLQLQSPLDRTGPRSLSCPDLPRPAAPGISGSLKVTEDRSHTPLMVGSVGSVFWRPSDACLSTRWAAGRGRCDRGLTVSKGDARADPRPCSTRASRGIGGGHRPSSSSSLGHPATGPPLARRDLGEPWLDGLFLHAGARIHEHDRGGLPRYFSP